MIGTTTNTSRATDMMAGITTTLGTGTGMDITKTMTKAKGTVTRIDGLRGLWRAVLVTKGPTGYHIAGGASVAA